MSENIRVVSVVGRFLEHSRIYSFERPDDLRIFIGSADLMPRNLYNRVELVTPVEDQANRDQLTDTLDRAFVDNTNSWELGGDGVWSRRTMNGDPPRGMQAELIERHVKRAEEAATTAV